MSIKELIKLGAMLADEGVIRGAGGNLSYREGKRIVITASGTKLEQLQEDGFVTLSLDGKRLNPDHPDLPRPSSEWALHLAAYQARPHATVVIHAHPPKAIALGILAYDLPALTPDQYLHLGSCVPLVPYKTPTTAQLAAAAATALKSHPAILLQNHGVIVTGETLKKAHLRLTLLEEASAIYLDALAVGTPRILSESDMQALDEVTGGRYRLR